MFRMGLVTATSHTSVNIRLVWIVVSLLFLLGSWLIGQGLWIHVKAMAAQWLLQRAWHQTLITQQPIQPWPWADTSPEGRLQVPRLGIDQIILGNSSGQSLAFGPGKVGNGTLSSDDTRSLILSGHRDTHFSFVRDIQHGDIMIVQTIQGDWHRFVVEEITVVNSRIEKLTAAPGRADLRLITCYPFDALVPGGPLRYVIIARPLAPKASFTQ